MFPDGHLTDHDHTHVAVCPDCGSEEFNVICKPLHGSFEVVKIECRGCKTDIIVEDGVLQ